MKGAFHFVAGVDDCLFSISQSCIDDNPPMPFIRKARVDNHQSTAPTATGGRRPIGIVGYEFYKCGQHCTHSVAEGGVFFKAETTAYLPPITGWTGLRTLSEVSFAEDN